MSAWVFQIMSVFSLSLCFSLVETLREHQGWIVNVHMQQYGSERTIVSCR